MTQDAIAAGVEALLGKGGVGEGAGAACRALPADAEQTAALVAWARAARLPLAVGHGATIALAMGSERTLSGAVRLDLARLARVRFYEPQDLTIGLEAGLTAGAIAAELARAQQCLPLDVTGGDAARLGAILAAHRSGPLRHYYGTVRDFIIGIEFVTAAGKLAHGGGRVVKNVAGYDLMRLMIGAQGTLGVITAANFKVFPRPAETETWGWKLAGWEQAEALRHALLQHPGRPLALELCGPPLQAYLRFGGGAGGRARWRRELAALNRHAGSAAEAVADEGAFWREYGAAAGGAQRWRLIAPAGSGVAALRALEDFAAAQGRALRWRGRLGLGVFELELAPELDGRRALDWRQAARRVHPEARLTRDDEPIETVLGGSGADLALMRKLHAAVGA